MTEEITPQNKVNQTHTSSTITLLVCAFFIVICSLLSCHEKIEYTAEAISSKDTLPFMHAKGINTLISDSGVMRYRMVAEEWDIYNSGREPATWKFMKGLLMERFDENFHVDLYIQSDTAYLHRQRTWELRGRVVIRNMRNEVFLTEELFWDMNTHEIWNHAFMHIITPERELQGTEFRSNESMTKYSVSNSSGAFPVSDTETSQTPNDTIYMMSQDETKESANVRKTTESITSATPHKNDNEKEEQIAKPIKKASAAKPTKQKNDTPVMIK